MRALVKFAGGPGNLEIRDVADPEVGHDDVLLRVAGTGICGTDLHIQDDEYVVQPPVVIGHELAGTVVAVGDGVTGLSIGTRVTAQTTIFTCGRCEQCSLGRLNLCPDRRWLGGHVDGGFAPYVRVPARNILVLPDHVSLHAGALTEPLACCVHGLLEIVDLESIPRNADDPVVISGPGPIGLLCAQVARAVGHRVVILGTAVDAARFAVARRLGFEEMLDVSATDPVAYITDMTHGHGVSLVVEAAGAGPSFSAATGIAKRRGTILQIGLYGRPASISLDRLVLREIILRGSFASTPTSWLRSLELMQAGAVDLAPLVTQVRPLEDWSAAFDAARARAEGKIVLVASE